MTLSPIDYEFIAPSRIVFGWGRRRELGTLARTLGRRAYAVIGSRTLMKLGIWEQLAESLRQAGVEPILAATISREPEVADVDALAKLLRTAGEDAFVLGIGGGSALDLAKAGAALATNQHGNSVLDYLEGVGLGLAIKVPPLPFLAMPTTGGTGTEATKNAVISSYSPPFKKSIRSPGMVAKIVLVDPELSVSVSAETTAWTGLDAITQLIESYLCRFAKPLPRALAIEGLRRALPALARAVADGTNRPAREAMAHAALLSGLALANSGLGLAHGVAAALGVTARVPHGLACAMMLPTALRVNRAIAQADLAELAQQTLPSCPANESAAADHFIESIQALTIELHVPTRLSKVGVEAKQLDELVRGSRGNSMNGNPCQLDDSELRSRLEAML